MAMSRLTKANPTARELVTEILDKGLWWNTLKVIVQFLYAKNVEEVRVEFGFVLERDLEGKPQGQNQIVQLSDLESFMQKALDEGTIEWAAGSDFLFHAVGADVAFMLCNDADLHFASANSLLLLELAHKIGSGGIKVYDSGQLI
jgi:hypothetical protein